MYCIISSACTINQTYVLCNLECLYDESNICIVYSRVLVRLIKHMYCVISRACTMNKHMYCVISSALNDKSNICIV